MTQRAEQESGANLLAVYEQEILSGLQPEVRQFLDSYTVEGYLGQMVFLLWAQQQKEAGNRKKIHGQVEKAYQEQTEEYKAITDINKVMEDTAAAKAQAGRIPPIIDRLSTLAQMLDASRTRLAESTSRSTHAYPELFNSLFARYQAGEAIPLPDLSDPELLLPPMVSQNLPTEPKPGRVLLRNMLPRLAQAINETVTTSLDDPAAPVTSERTPEAQTRRNEQILTRSPFATVKEFLGRSGDSNEMAEYRSAMQRIVEAYPSVFEDIIKANGDFWYLAVAVDVPKIITTAEISAIFQRKPKGFPPIKSLERALAAMYRCYNKELPFLEPEKFNELAQDIQNKKETVIDKSLIEIFDAIAAPYWMKMQGFNADGTPIAELTGAQSTPPLEANDTSIEVPFPKYIPNPKRERDFRYAITRLLCWSIQELDRSLDVDSAFSKRRFPPEGINIATLDKLFSTTTMERGTGPLKKYLKVIHDETGSSDFSWNEHSVILLLIASRATKRHTSKFDTFGKAALQEVNKLLKLKGLKALRKELGELRNSKI